MNNFSIFFKKIGSLIYHSLINSLFPNYCWTCGDILTRDQYAYCEECFAEIPRIAEQTHCNVCSSLYFVDSDGFCQSCQMGFHEEIYFKRNISCFSYLGPIQNLILQGKFNNRHGTWKLLAREMVKAVIELDGLEGMVLIPVPISKKRMAERGFNQSARMGKIIARTLSIPYIDHLLIKIKNNTRQVKLGHDDRKSNPVDCYKVLYNKGITGASILLIDDVFTTGSTVNECSRVLVNNGARKVIVLTAAKRDFA